MKSQSHQVIRPHFGKNSILCVPGATPPKWALRMKPVTMFFLFITVANTAHADWQYTNWGMTAAEVKKASKGRTQEMSPEEIKGKSSTNSPCLLKHRYTAGQLELQASLCFSAATNRLVSVTVDPVPSDSTQCSIIEEDLRKKYGGPISDTKDSVSHVLRWRDAQVTTEIWFYQSRLSDHCHATYAAVHTEETQGL